MLCQDTSEVNACKTIAHVHLSNPYCPPKADIRAYLSFTRSHPSHIHPLTSSLHGSSRASRLGINLMQGTMGQGGSVRLHIISRWSMDRGSEANDRGGMAIQKAKAIVTTDCRGAVGVIRHRCGMLGSNRGRHESIPR